jgi:hypothetical protein
MIRRGYFFFQCKTVPIAPGSPHCRGFPIILRHTTLGRNPLDECSARRSNPYLTTHKTHNRHPSILGGIQTRDPRKRAAADPSLIPRATARLRAACLATHLPESLTGLCFAKHCNPTLMFLNSHKNTNFAKQQFFH